MSVKMKVYQSFDGKLTAIGDNGFIYDVSKDENQYTFTPVNKDVADNKVLLSSLDRLEDMGVLTIRTDIGNRVILKPGDNTSDYWMRRGGERVGVEHKWLEDITTSSDIMLNADDQWQSNGGGASGTGFTIMWQHGPVIKGCMNGAKMEEVLASCVDRLQHCQAMPGSQFEENEVAIQALREAIVALEARSEAAYARRSSRK